MIIKIRGDKLWRWRHEERLQKKQHQLDLPAIMFLKFCFAHNNKSCTSYQQVIPEHG